MSTSTQRLEGKIALVTGSTNGIGLAIADRIARDGAKVIVSSRGRKNVDDTVKKLKQKGYDVVGVVCHIGEEDQRRNLVRAIEKLGRLDIFVQCAGVNPFVGLMMDCPEEAWDKTFHINLKSTFLMTKALLPLLRKSSSARIIYNSSISAYVPYEVLGAYQISKIALVGLTKSAALHLGRYNITVNCVVPGIIDTAFGEVVTKDEVVKTLLGMFGAIKRVGKPEEVAGIVAFLASDESSYITGEAVCVTGGLSSRL